MNRPFQRHVDRQPVLPGLIILVGAILYLVLAGAPVALIAGWVKG